MHYHMYVKVTDNSLVVNIQCSDCTESMDVLTHWTQLYKIKMNIKLYFNQKKSKYFLPFI